ncbi:MAG: Crp/Fnr family transcriptional regulator [Actinomycetota bacterium]
MAERLTRWHEPLPLTPLRTGQAVIRQGEHAPGLWRVRSGVLTAAAVGNDGRELTLDVLGPGDPVGEPDGAVSAHTVRAMRPSRLVPVAGCDAEALLATRSRRREALACDLAWLGVDERVARRLDDLASRFGKSEAGGTVIPFTLTQETLASLAGTTRESANRAIRRLVAFGTIAVVGRGRYLVRHHLRAATG